MIINTWNRLTGACFCMFIAGLLPLTVYAKTFEVRDTDDLPDINPGDGRCETTTLGCTLRAAIMELNRTFEPNDRIILRAGVYRLTIPPVTRSFPLADDGDLYLGHSQPLEIIGDDANTTVIEQTVEDRVMQIGGGADVSISSVTFRGGRAVETRREGGFSKSEGGGLAIAGDVHLNQIIVTGNQAVGGGGIAAHVSSGRLRIENTVIENNEATETGGGIGFIAPYPGSGTLELRDSIIDSNRAGTKGGGLSFAGRGEKLDIAYTKITNNRAGSGETEPCYCDGGGIFYKTVYPRYSSDIESRRRDRNGRIIDTLIRGNAAYRGGGIYQYGFDPLLVERILIAENRAKDGGGMVVRGPIDITNSTFSGNVAEFGGAIAGQFNPAGILGTDIRVRNAIDLHNTTIADNQAIFGSGIFTNSDKFSVSARGTIFANLPQERNCNLAGRSALNSLDSNLDSGLSCDLSGANDLIDMNPRLIPLRDNGGFTETHALRPSSPAIDSNYTPYCGGFDQRRAARPAGRTCDIGAFELGAEVLRRPIEGSGESFIYWLGEPVDVWTYFLFNPLAGGNGYRY